MTEHEARAKPEISVVVPVVERHGDLRQIFAEYAAQLESLGRPGEFIFVVDQRQRETVPILREIQGRARQEVILILLGGMFGESAALTVGMEHARGDVIVTLASYFQVDPRGLGAALREIDAGADLVIGRRYPRIDSWFNRLQSRVFHAIVRLLTASRFGDISSGFRVMKRSVSRDLAVYGGIHRFIPVLALRRGFVVRELEMAQRQEDVSTRWYGVGVYVKRLLDVFTVFFLIKFTHRPLRFFGVMSLLLAAPGLAITGYLGVYRLLGLGPIAQRPLLLLGVLLVVLGIQLLSIGLIGEIIVFTHARKIREYRVSEIISGSSGPEKAAPRPSPRKAGGLRAAGPRQ